MKNKKLPFILSLLVCVTILSPISLPSPSGRPLQSLQRPQAKADTSAPADNSPSAHAKSQASLEGTSVDASSVKGVKDPAELETFLDDLFTKQMTDYGIAGLTFSLVKDGQVFFQKGYGYADLENQTPVDPANTIFRTGSVTKLFTWTAVMQLVEQGKLDLDADVNTYLDFKIPDTFPEPITLKHLLSHTAGFEDLALGTKVAIYDQIQPLGQYLTSHLPARVRPVGLASVYSNYGADLAGYIVERVSGMPYADYLETNIFKPLGMEHTTARLPLPAELVLQLSTGYSAIQGTLQPGIFQIPNTQPDCCVSSTAADMARFMIAHLNSGQLPGGTGKILETATTKQMQTSLWTPDVRLNGFAYGFMEVVLNGQRILYHGGDINPFHGLLVLIPDQNLGFFVAYNTDTSASLWALDLLSFVEHYFPQTKVTAQSPEGFDAQAVRFSGYYRPMRGAYTTLEKVNVLKTWAVVKPSHDGALLWQPALSPLSIRIVESEPLLFVEPQSGLTSVFTEDSHQNITYVFDALPAGMPYEKLPWHANPYLHYGLLGACILLFLFVVLAIPADFVLRLFKKGKPISQSLAQAARWLAFLVATLDLVGLGFFLVLFIGRGDAIFYAQMSILQIMLAAWLIAAILIVPLLVLAVLSWKNRYWGVASRVHYSLMAVAALAFVWFLNYWNLLGFRY
ncbi:MAG: serine hydrolase domain-containing protein [Anaerolineaceae bacterium]